MATSASGSLKTLASRLGPQLVVAAAASTAALTAVRLVTRRVSEQAEFLSDASLAIGAEPDVPRALQRAAAFAVPRLADSIAIDWAGPDGFRRAAEASRDGRLPPRSAVASLILRADRPLGADHAAAVTFSDSTGTWAGVPIVRHKAVLGVLICGRHHPRRLATRDVHNVHAYVQRIAAAVGHHPDSAEPWQPSSSTLAMLAHELRAPVNAVLGWTKLLQTGHLTGAMAARALTAIERCTETQNRLVTDMFDLSRILLGTYRLRLERVDLSAIVQRAIDAVTPVASGRGIAIAFDAGRATPIMGDALRLQQAVTNLLVNAIKHSVEGGQITIALEQVDSQVTLSVRDTGEGIAPDLLPYVFEPLARTTGPDTAQDGAGLGLALVRKIAELHGGQATAASDGPGTGALFRLMLPHGRATHSRSAQVLADEASTTAPRLLEGLRVLVVSDQPQALREFADTLAAYGAVVDAVGSAADAAQAVAKQRPDIVVSDVKRAERMKVLATFAPASGSVVPALAVSSYRRGADHLEFLADGFHLHLTKPLSAAELAQAVRALVPAPRSVEPGGGAPDHVERRSS